MKLKKTNPNEVTIAQAERAISGLCDNDEGLNFSMRHLGLSNQEVEEKYPSLEAVDDLELNDLARLEDDSLYAAGMRVVQDILHEMAVAGRTRHVLSSTTATTTTTCIVHADP